MRAMRAPATAALCLRRNGPRFKPSTHGTSTEEAYARGPISRPGDHNTRSEAVVARSVSAPEWRVDNDQRCQRLRTIASYETLPTSLHIPHLGEG